jgi:hypothetical protein
MLRGGLPSHFIAPYLCGAAVIALIVAGIAWWLVLLRRRPSVGIYSLAAVVFYITFALSAGALVVAAESIAEQVAMHLGRRGESGTYRDFYPDDSGMSHWPTRWTTIPFVAGYLTVIWLPSLYLITFLSAVCESKFQTRHA